MKAYRTIKFIESPDLVDLQSQARKSSEGRSGARSVRGGIKDKRAKAATRRIMKRADKAATAKIDFAE